MQVVYTIADNKFSKFKEAFLIAQPVPHDPDTGEPIMGENKWIKQWGLEMYKRAYKRGIKLQAERQAIVDDEIISVAD